MTPRKKSESVNLDSTRKTRVEAALVTALLICALAGTACAPPADPSAKQTSDSTPPSARLDHVAANYGWVFESARRSKLSDYRGKVVVLDFYATWCEPCRIETPHLVELQRLYGDQGLQVIGLNVGGEEDRDKIPDFAKEFGIQYPLAIPEKELADAYLTEDRIIPQAFVFDRGGKLVKRFVGYTAEGGQELERVIQASLGSEASGQ